MISTIGFVDHGGSILGGYYLLTSGLSFIGSSGATKAGTIMARIGFWSLAAYNFYLDHADVPNGRIFRDNFIGMNIFAISSSIADHLSKKNISEKEQTAGIFLNSAKETIELKISW